jgi:hypothetical protein
MPEGTQEDARDCQPEHERALALRILRGEVSTQEAACSHGLTVAEVEALKERFLDAAEDALGPQVTDKKALARRSDAACGDDVGIWVCASGSRSLAPCLFIQSVCAGRFPLEATALWSRAGCPPKPFERAGALSLLHGECGETLDRNNRVYLFSAKAPDSQAVE